jgi:hypothetical protein
LQPLTDEFSTGPLVYPGTWDERRVALMLTVGAGLTVTVTLFDVALQLPQLTTSV